MFKQMRIALERVLATRGYVLRQQTATPRGYSEFLRFIKARGFSPETVIDVGVGYGTPWLHEAFTDAKLVLVEPQSVFTSELESFEKSLNADVHRVGLGSKPGSMEINYPHGLPTSGSVMQINEERKEMFYSDGSFVTEQVPIVTLDSINTYAGPQLLKIDVEGFEIEVLRGALESLKKTELIIVEASLLPRFEGEAGCGALISYLHDCGWNLIDFAHIEPFGSGGPPAFADFVFAPRSSDLAKPPQQ